MITGTKKATDIVFDRMKIAIVGEPKIGKDWLANTAPGDIFNFDFDDRLDSLAKHPNRARISGKTYYDELPTVNPHAWLDFESDVTEFQEMKRRGEKIPDWFVLSSMQFVSDAAENYVLYNNPGMRQEVFEDKRNKTGKLIAYVPFGWDPYNIVIECVKNNINALHSIANLICVFHEAPEIDKMASTPKQPVYTGKLSVYPANLRKLLPLFNDMWRVVTSNNERRVITDCSDYKFVGATSLLVDSEEDPDISKMLEKHKQALAK